MCISGTPLLLAAKADSAAPPTRSGGPGRGTYVIPASRPKSIRALGAPSRTNFRLSKLRAGNPSALLFISWGARVMKTNPSDGEWMHCAKGTLGPKVVLRERWSEIRDRLSLYDRSGYAYLPPLARARKANRPRATHARGQAVKWRTDGGPPMRRCDCRRSRRATPRG